MKGTLRGGAVCAVMAIGAAACDLPQAPSWDVGMLVPFTRVSLSIDDLLPTGVTTGEVQGTAAFIVDVSAELADYSLGLMCDACRVLQGTSGTVPSFQYADTLQVDFPPGLLGVEIVTSRLGYELTNNLNFDPLRPSQDPDSAGFLRLRALDAATGIVLDSLVMSGVTGSFPSGSSRELSLEIEDATIQEGIVLEVFLDSPADEQVVTIDTTLAASARPIIDTLAVAAVTVELQDRTLEESFQIDFDRELRQELQDDLKGATIELELAHSLEVAGTLEISLAGSSGDLFSDDGGDVRLDPVDFSFAPEGRRLEDELSGDQIRFLAGLPQVFIGFVGSASALESDPLGRPAVTFTPTDSIAARLQVTGILGVKP